MKKLDSIKKTVQILSSVSYENYSDEKAKTYLEYMEGSRADEDRLISPVLLRKFLEDVLGFKLGETIATQESKGVGRPDYIPVDTRTHPFVFDAKGTDTRDLSQHYPQIKKYIESQGLRYGILTNMRDLDVYTSEKGIEIEEYDFNFVKLYQDYKQSPVTCLEEENTKRFLDFVERFSYTQLTTEKKIERIATAEPWTGKEELNVKALTDQLRHIVNILYEDVKQHKSELSAMAEAGSVSDEYIAAEIETISSQISGREIKEVNSETFNEFMNASDETSYGTGRDAFFHRVAYFAMTRLLLARVWEDIGFVEQSLYNGGFAKWYENFNREIRRVLHYAFDLSAERYPWLFNADNNYSWYEPSDKALIDSLYELSNFYLGKLDQDILGTIYEDYIERVDKKNKGQYYTPREIVSFIWDRVGYTTSKAFFWYIEGKRRPKLVFDPATGSGGFLVEAARRIRECSEFDWNEPQDLWDIHQAILWYIFGSEISLFPYYLTQVNLLIQLTPVIRRHIELTGKKPRKEPTPLGVICRDSMELHNEEQKLFEEEIELEKQEHRREILHMPIPEKRIHEKIRSKLVGKIAYCCANPPYVGEKGHKQLFRQTLNLYPYWKKYYQGKMDYLYWFIILGLSKLRNPGVKAPPGKLGFITSAYWPTADGASKLRKYILENAKIKEMIFFEEVKIFEHAKGQHNMVFVLTKCSGEDKKEERGNNHIKIVQVKCKNHDLPGKTIRENLDFLTKHIQEHIDKPGYEDEYIKVFWSGVKQGELTDSRWDIFYSESLGEILGKIKDLGEPLKSLCFANEGVKTSANILTKGLKAKLTDSSPRIGSGIYVLTEDELRHNEISSEVPYIKPFFVGEDICPYVIDRKEAKYLLYADNNFNINDYPAIKWHLERFRPALENRAEVDSGRYRWYSLLRPRKRSIFEDEKIVTPYRSEHNCFALCEDKLYGPTGIYFITKKSGTVESLEYLAGLLNSKLIDFWMDHKCRKKAKIREYTSSTLHSIPLHRINFDNPKEVRMHDGVVNKVKSTREKMSELAKYSKYFSGLRLTKLEFDAPLPEVNDEAIIKSIAPENQYSIRTHPEIKIEQSKGFRSDKFYLSKVDKPELTLTGNVQVNLKGKTGTSVFIEGPRDLLTLLACILSSSNWKNKSWSEIKEKPLLPDNIVSFNVQKTRVLNEVSDERAKILQLQTEIDQIVYKLYGLSENKIEIVNSKFKT